MKILINRPVLVNVGNGLVTEFPVNEEQVMDIIRKELLKRSIIADISIGCRQKYDK